MIYFKIISTQFSPLGDVTSSELPKSQCIEYTNKHDELKYVKLPFMHRLDSELIRKIEEFKSEEQNLSLDVEDNDPDTPLYVIHDKYSPIAESILLPFFLGLSDFEPKDILNSLELPISNGTLGQCLNKLSLIIDFASIHRNEKLELICKDALSLLMKQAAVEFDDIPVIAEFIYNLNSPFETQCKQSIERHFLAMPAPKNAGETERLLANAHKHRFFPLFKQTFYSLSDEDIVTLATSNTFQENRQLSDSVFVILSETTYHLDHLDITRIPGFEDFERRFVAAIEQVATTPNTLLKRFKPDLLNRFEESQQVFSAIDDYLSSLMSTEPTNPAAAGPQHREFSPWVELNEKDENGDTLLNLLMYRRGVEKVVKSMLAAGADPTVVNCYGKSPLNALIKERNFPLLNACISYGYGSDIRHAVTQYSDTYECSPLVAWVKSGDVEMISFSMAMGLEAEIIDTLWSTIPQENLIEIAQVLSSRGYDMPANTHPDISRTIISQFIDSPPGAQTNIEDNLRYLYAHNVITGEEDYHTSFLKQILTYQPDFKGKRAILLDRVIKNFPCSTSALIGLVTDENNYWLANTEAHYSFKTAAIQKIFQDGSVSENEIANVVDAGIRFTHSLRGFDRNLEHKFSPEMALTQTLWAKANDQQKLEIIQTLTVRTHEFVYWISTKKMPDEFIMRFFRESMAILKELPFSEDGKLTETGKTQASLMTALSQLFPGNSCDPIPWAAPLALFLLENGFPLTEWIEANPIQALNFLPSRKYITADSSHAAAAAAPGNNNVQLYERLAGQYIRSGIFNMTRQVNSDFAPAWGIIGEQENLPLIFAITLDSHYSGKRAIQRFLDLIQIADSVSQSAGNDSPAQCLVQQTAKKDTVLSSLLRVLHRRGNYLIGEYAQTVYDLAEAMERYYPGSLSTMTNDAGFRKNGKTAIKYFEQINSKLQQYEKLIDLHKLLPDYPPAA